MLLPNFFVSSKPVNLQPHSKLLITIYSNLLAILGVSMTVNLQEPSKLITIYCQIYNNLPAILVVTKTKSTRAV